jgi:small-conductance mechanosensitive channel
LACGVWINILTRGFGFAFNEVVVSMAGKPDGQVQLQRFTRMLAIVTMVMMAMVALTPLGEIWFSRVSGLSPELTHLSSVTVMFAILMPGYQVYQSWYGGMLVHYHKTRGISEAVLVYVIMALFGLWLGTQMAIVQEFTGQLMFLLFQDYVKLSF